MIITAIESVKSKITALPFVEVFGGLAIPVTKYDEVYDKDGNVIGSKRTTFPVTCGMDAISCFQNGKYQDLVPNSSRASIFYFENITNLRLVKADGPKAGILTFQGKVRLVGWLNLQKLGHTDQCTISPIVTISIIKALNVVCSTISPLNGGSLKFTNFAIQPSSTDVFSQYTYNKDIQLNMFPFETVAIVMDVILTVGAHCVDEYMNGVAVDLFWG